jgi:hypothetical protein
MDASIFGALAAVCGSLVGGLATFATAWITQRTSSRRELVRAEIRKRELLYGRFISECSRLIMDSLVRALERPEAMLPIYALLNRIRLTASDDVLVEAEQIMRRITEQYFSPNLSQDELRALVVSQGSADPLKPFGEVCRVELTSMHKAV